MIDTMSFENENGDVFRMSDYGLLLKSFDAPEPQPKTYIQPIEGADGDLDLTEWSGTIRYENREVTIAIRDMSNRWWRELVNFCHGRTIKATHSDDPEYYYEGRCVASHSTRQRVTDVVLTMSCNPYRLASRETMVLRNVEGAAIIPLRSLRRPVVPRIKTTARMEMQFEGMPFAMEAGEQEVPFFVITDTVKPLQVTGTGTIEIFWRDGVL